MKVYPARNSDAADSAIKHVTMMGANKWDGNHVILREGCNQLMIASCGLKFWRTEDKKSRLSEP